MVEDESRLNLHQTAPCNMLTQHYPQSAIKTSDINQHNIQTEEVSTFYCLIVYLAAI
jgi:hypothetical protein